VELRKHIALVGRLQSYYLNLHDPPDEGIYAKISRKILRFFRLAETPEDAGGGSKQRVNILA
jgi:hypothetical protein